MSTNRKKISLVYASKVLVKFKDNKFLHIMLTVYVIIFIILSISPTNVFVWQLENITSAVAVISLVVLYRKNRMTNLAYFCIMVLLILHSIGAHYTYSLCPVGNWVKEFFKLKRNNYDRFVCFSFGILASVPMLEFLYHRFRLRYKQACVFSILLILSICALYEIAQVYFATQLNAGQAELFLGIQGDLMDTQNDMAGVLSGALISMGMCIISRTSKKRNIQMIKKEKD